MELVQQPLPELTAVVYARVSTKEQAQGGGDADGFSLPAQRDACRRKAASLGASVVEEYVDRGESARSADRAELQHMLTFLERERVDFVIVHKIDRLARNRGDDVAITAAIQASGAKLVSVTENIDETPSGLLLHGIMSSIAEFYSRNLANEVIKGTQQKVSGGGTPNAAPIGYRNVRKLVDGFEIRTVEVDPERAPLINWAFEAYASGDWSLNALAAELADRGLTYHATAKRSERPVGANKLGDILRRPYYRGIVRWRGVEYQGKHAPLVSAETFAQVQQVLETHRASGERSWKHDHYLSGTLRCGKCKSRLRYMQVAGRNGATYGYFACAGRHSGRNACAQRYLPEHFVEDAVAAQWLHEQVPEEDLPLLREQLVGDVAAYRQQSSLKADQLRERAHKIKRDRFKWADKVMDGTVPDDIAREKQTQLSKQLANAETQLARLTELGNLQAEALSAVLDLIEHCGDADLHVPPALRRIYNQAWFSSIDIDETEDGVTVAAVSRPDLLDAIRDAQVSDRPQPDMKRPRTPDDQEAWVNDHVGVLNVELLVGAEGLEPPTPGV